MTRFQLLVHRISVWAHNNAFLERAERQLPGFTVGLLTGLFAALARSL